MLKIHRAHDKSAGSERWAGTADPSRQPCCMLSATSARHARAVTRGTAIPPGMPLPGSLPPNPARRSQVELLGNTVFSNVHDHDQSNPTSSSRQPIEPSQRATACRANLSILPLIGTNDLYAKAAERG
jgi:hypothetical protein